VLSAYQRFEATVALTLTLIIAAVIFITLCRLIASVVDVLVLQLDPLDHTVFQRVFGEIMTLLIALEFKHTLQYVVTSRSTDSHGHGSQRGSGGRRRENREHEETSASRVAHAMRNALGCHQHIAGSHRQLSILEQEYSFAFED
jgi:hypothetical protein